MNNSITKLLQIKYPVVQAGMVWCCGWELASAVSNAGGLGVLGAGSMTPELLTEHINKTRKATTKPFAVNVPLMMKNSEDIIANIIEHKVPVVITSAGSPSKYTQRFQEAGIKVLHVVANSKFALKCQEAGVDAIIAEGFEAGGHNGREETTSFTLIPLIRKITNLPLIAAGGIYDAKSMLAAMILGADGIQIGSRFAVSMESSAHSNFKQRVIEASDGETVLTLKKLAPVRFIKNKFYEQVTFAEENGASISELRDLLGKGRARKAIFEGNLDDGEIEIGQVSAMITEIQPAAEILNEIITEFKMLTNNILHNSKFNF